MTTLYEFVDERVKRLGRLPKQYTVNGAIEWGVRGTPLEGHPFVERVTGCGPCDSEYEALHGPMPAEIEAEFLRLILVDEA